MMRRGLTLQRSLALSGKSPRQGVSPIYAGLRRCMEYARSLAPRHSAKRQPSSLSAMQQERLGGFARALIRWGVPLPEEALFEARSYPAARMETLPELRGTRASMVVPRFG